MVALGIGFAVGALGEKGAAVPGLLAIGMWGFVALLEPLWVARGGVLLAATSEALGNVEVPGWEGGPSVSGLLWLAALGLASLHVLTGSNGLRLPQDLWPFLGFVVWASVRWASGPWDPEALKEILWFGLPVAVRLFTQVLLEKREGDADLVAARVERTVLFSGLVPVALYVVALTGGLAEMTWRGPRGELVGTGRGAPIFLLMCLGVALSVWRFGPNRRMAAFLSALYTASIFASLARTASFLALTAVMVALLAKARVRGVWALAAGAGIALATAAYAVSASPLLQNRFFWEVPTGGMGDLQSLKTAGRWRLWPAVLVSALEAPWFGHGLGTARKVAAGAFPETKDVTEYHPHNEWLQVFHDLGAVGVVFLLWAWGGVLLRVARRWASATSDVSQKRSMAATIACAAVVATSITGNTLHKPFAVGVAMLLVGISEYARSGRSRPDG